MGLKEIQELKERAKEPKVKKTYSIPKFSKKRLQQIEQDKELRNGDDTLLQKWFNARRKQMTGVCGCGCGEPSQKKDDLYFRHCICHVFPQRHFPTLMYHPRNWIERKFWGGHHTNLDNQSMDLWVNMADWDKIKEIFHELAPLLTDEERATKFYTQLEKLVYAN